MRSSLYAMIAAALTLCEFGSIQAFAQSKEQNTAYAFNDFLVKDVYRGPSKMPDFQRRDHAYASYRTRIRDGLKDGANFAGHYAFIAIGCGMECTLAYVVDVTTGQVYGFSLGGEANLLLNPKFTVQSNLIITHWVSNERCFQENVIWKERNFVSLGKFDVGASDDCTQISQTPVLTGSRPSTTLRPSQTNEWQDVEEHAAAAMNALKMARQKIASSEPNAALIYNNMAGLRSIARHELGCATISDQECMTSTASAARSFGPNIMGQWNILWVAEMFHELSRPDPLSTEKEILQAMRNIDALRALLNSKPEAGQDNVFNAMKNTSSSVALAAEVSGEALRLSSQDIREWMTKIQIAFHGEAASITEPGYLISTLLEDVVNLLVKAEQETDLASADFSIPSGHILINMSHQ